MDQTRNEWDAVYKGARPEDLPWFSTRLDPDFEHALRDLRLEPPKGPVLDLGTGPGTVAIELARRGFDVVALDVSPVAIDMARRRAGDLGKRIQWVTANLFDQGWSERFQLVCDRGVYHSLPTQERHRYPDVIAGWLKPLGYLIVKTFSPDEPGDWGPHRIERQELEHNLGGRLDVVGLQASTFPGTLGHEPRAWFAVFQRPRGVP